MYTNDKKVIKTHSLFAILLKLYDFEMVRVMHLLIRTVISYAELSNAFYGFSYSICVKLSILQRTERRKYEKQSTSVSSNVDDMSDFNKIQDSSSNLH